MPFRPTLRLPTLGLGLAILASPAAAQARPDSAAARLDSVVVVGVPTPTAVGGASAVVITPARLAYPPTPAPSLSELLRKVPFVLIRQNSRGENEISVRGSDSRQAAVLIEGLPVTLGWDSRIDPSLVPLTGVQQVTVTRGLSSLVGGPNVLGGMVEFGMTPSANAGATSRRDLTVASGIDGYGAYAVSAAGGVRHATSLGMLTARVGASQRARDGVALSRNGGSTNDPAAGAADPGQDGEGRLRTNSDLHELDGFAAVRLEGPRGRHLGATVTGFDADRGVPAELHVASPRFWRYPDVSRRLAILSAGTGTGTTPLGVGSLSASAGLSTSALQINTYSDATYATVTAREYGDERTTTIRLLGTHSFLSRGQLRGSYTHSEVRYDERFNDAAAVRYRQRLGSAALEAEWAVGTSTDLSAGIVHDRADTPESGGRTPLGEIGKLGWRLGASTRGAHNAVRFHASVSQRSRFPALRELYSGALNRFDPNPDLKPETLVGAEFGATLVSGPVSDAGMSLQAVLFTHRLDDAVVRVTLPDRKFRRINRDEIKSHGLELVAGWTSTPGRDHGVSVTGDLLLQSVRVHDQTIPTGQANAARAEHQPEFRTSWDVGLPLPLDLRGIGSVRHTGRQFCQHPDLRKLVELNAQTVASVAVTRTWSAAGGDMRGVLAVDNIGDTTVYDQCGLPQPGRTIRVGVELR